MKECAPIELSDGSIDFGDGIIGPNSRDQERAAEVGETVQKAEGLSEKNISWLKKIPLSAKWGFRFGAPALTLAALSAISLAADENTSHVEASDINQTHIEQFDPRPFSPAISGHELAVSAEVDKPSVRVVYLVPADKQVNPEYAEGIENAMKDIQRWFFDKLGNGNSFRLHSPDVQIVQSSRDAEWFRYNPSNSTPLTQYIANVTSEAENLLPEFHDGDKWVILVDAESAQGQLGAAASLDIAAILDADFLRGLAGEFTPNEGQAPNTIYSNIGVVAHELAHTWELDHPETDCIQDPCLLMAYPYNYPLAELDQYETKLLESSFFLNHQFTANNPDFQVEVRMSNLTNNAFNTEQFSLNGSEFMYMYFPLDSGRLDISRWVQPGDNKINMDAFGTFEAFTYGFEIYINDNLAYQEICGEAGVTNCDGLSFNDSYSFDAPSVPSTPTPTTANTPTFTPTNTPTAEHTPTPTEQIDLQTGDVNCDTAINALDSAFILQLTAGLIDDLECNFNGDVNSDGTISPIDATLILQFDAGLIDSF